MALTQTSSISSISPVVPAAGAERQTPIVTAPTSDQTVAASAPVAVAPTAVQALSPAVSAAIGFSLRFDPETERMILEARDAITGFIIQRIPSKYVVKQFSARVSSTVVPARGTRIDNAS
jgi:hypothetical protein